MEEAEEVGRSEWVMPCKCKNSLKVWELFVVFFCVDTKVM